MKDKTIVEKDLFIATLVKEFESMMYNNPKCDFEHHWNITLEKVIDNVKTFYDDNPDENIEVGYEFDDERQKDTH